LKGVENNATINENRLPVVMTPGNLGKDSYRATPSIAICCTSMEGIERYPIKLVLTQLGVDWIRNNLKMGGIGQFWRVRRPGRWFGLRNPINLTLRNKVLGTSNVFDEPPTILYTFEVISLVIWTPKASSPPGILSSLNRNDNNARINSERGICSQNMNFRSAHVGIGN
jgi:hypothetical protein